MKPLHAALLCLTLGGIAGAGIALLVWKYADTNLRSQFTQGGAQLATALAQGQGQVTALAAQGAAGAAAAVQSAINTQVIPAVRASVQQQLVASGITPTLIAQAKQVLTLARQAGVIT